MYNIDMKKTGSRESLYSLASSQWGLFTSAQALVLGVNRIQLARMLGDGRIESVSYGTYRLAAGEETNHCGLKASWLSLYPKPSAFERLRARPYDAVVMGRTAACMHGDTDMYETPYVFAIKKGKRTAREDVKLFPWEIDEQDIVIIEGLPVSSVERTIADLVRMRDDPSLVGNFMAGASKRGHNVNETRLATLLAPLASRNGFPKNAGSVFAKTLISDNVEAHQISRAANVLMSALAASPSYQNLSDYIEGRGISKAALETKSAPPDVSSLSFMPALDQLRASLDPYQQLQNTLNPPTKDQDKENKIGG
ncbi:MAG: type IV toxin-antitoxin system AbiEi family antitoxin domain-containing protein [Raoultibacter sp.]